jgi:hypothetical protein
LPLDSDLSTITVFEREDRNSKIITNGHFCLESPVWYKKEETKKGKDVSEAVEDGRII